MIDFSVAYDKLAQFETASEIASFLRSAGISGIQRSGTQCPISRWVSVCTEKLVYTGHSAIWFNPPGPDIMGYDLDNAEESREMTPAMDAFITAFDRGEYPDMSLGVSPGGSWKITVTAG